MLRLVLAIALATVAIASPVSVNNPALEFYNIVTKDAGNANEYMDLVLENLNALLPALVL